ncbi:hypothetical protein LBMAG21_04630 [Armatimonadota bacterium]|nr:hypothetical protein LBMAG21_04630 [Armatimonadota bacterium]
MSLQPIINYLAYSERIGSAGQPTVEQFASIQEAGYEAVLSLLPDRPPYFQEEEAQVRALGMDFARIPVEWDTPQLTQLEAFFERMSAWKGRRVFVHCAMNMRVSAFLYLYHTLRVGSSEAEAHAKLTLIWEPEGVWEEFVADAKAYFQKV